MKTQTGCWKREADASEAFAPLANFFSVNALEEEPDGSMLVARDIDGKHGGLSIYGNGGWTTFQRNGLDGHRLRVSKVRRLSDGSLWMGTQDGLVVLRGKQIERYSVADRLSSNSIEDILEDHEGNMWVLTDDGLDSFRIPSVLTFSNREGAGRGAGAVLAGYDGSVYVSGGSMWNSPTEAASPGSSRNGRAL